MKLEKQIFFLLIYILLGFKATAQESLDCGTKTSKLPYLVDETRLKNARVFYTSPLLMKIFVHIIANNDGTNRAVADTSMIRQLENMQEFYAPQGICFILGGISQINSTDLNTQNADTEEGELTAHLINGFLNIFVHNTLFDTKGSLNGNAYSIPNTYISVSKNAVESIDNRSTTAHEIGHCFGLYHTFEKNYGVENIARSGQCENCSTTGDLLCDTQADPHSDSYDTANHITNCNFSDLSLDVLCGGVTQNYRMDPHNIMAYGVRSCRDIFTNGQGTRARGIITTNNSLEACIAPDDVNITGIQTISSGLEILQARTNISFISSSFIINGSTVLNVTSNNEIDVKPGTIFSPSSGDISLKIGTLCD